MRPALAGLRHRPAPLIGVLVALVAAASVVTWTFSIAMSGATSVLPAQRLAGAAAAVLRRPEAAITSGRGPSASTEVAALTSYRPVPASLAARLARLPGVAAAVADRAVPLALVRSDGAVVPGTLTGAAWSSARLTPFRLRSGHAPAGPRQLVLGAALARRADLGVGDQVRVAGRPGAAFTVVGIATAPGGNPAGVGTVFLTGAEIGALAGHPAQADLIGVVARPGTSAEQLATRVRRALAGRHLDVVTGRARGRAADLTATANLENLGQLAGGAGVPFVLISLFVAASAVALSVAERARTMALLRAVGATPGQVRRSVMAELAVLGLVGGVLGYLPGTWLAELSVRGLAAHQVVPAATRTWTNPIEMAVAAGAAIVVAELAGVLAARRASRIRPSAALGEATVERRRPRLLRLLLGLGALGGGIALSVVVLGQSDASQQLEDAELVLLAFMAAVAFLGPYLVSVTEVLLRIPVRLVGGTAGRLASAELRTRSRRLAAATVAIALPVAFVGAIVTIDATQTHASVTESPARLAASAVVTAPGPGLAPSVLAAVRAQPGVTGAVGLVPTTVYVPDPGEASSSAEAVSPGPLTSLLHLHVTAGSLAHFGPGDIALSRLEAGTGAVGTHVGQRITATLADGTPYRATVTAIFSRSLGFADVLVPTGAAGGGHLGAATFGEILVQSARGAPAAAVPLRALSRQVPGLEVATRAVANGQDELLAAQNSYVNDLLLALVGLLAAVALVNALVVTTLQGRDELTLLDRVGASGRQLLARTAWQATQVTLLGVVLGVGAAATAVLAVTQALTGSSVPWIPWGSVALVLGLVVLATGCATLVPTAMLLRPRREPG